MTNCNLLSTQSIELVLFILFALILYSFCFSSIISLNRRHNLQSYRGSCLSTVQTSHDRRRSTSLKSNDAHYQPSIPIKPDHLIFKTGHCYFYCFRKGLRSVFILCGNTLPSQILSDSVNFLSGTWFLGFFSLPE
jgi:hypothetical protein